MGGLEDFGRALKAFRRGVYQFPAQWRAAVVCSTSAQAKFAYDNAVCVMNAGSLPIRTRESERRIETDRGGIMVFVVLDQTFFERLRGQDFPQVIVLAELSPETKGYLQRRNRFPTIDPKYFRWDECTL